MNHFSQVIVLIAILALGSTLEAHQSVIDTYENTKKVNGSLYGTPYYPNTDLFPVGGRIFGISFAIGLHIDRIDWDIVDANDNKLHLQMGYSNRIISQYFYLPEGSTLQSVRLYYVICSGGVYCFTGIQLYGSNGQTCKVYGSDMYKARYYGQIDFTYPLIGFFGDLNKTTTNINGLGFIMVRRYFLNSPEYSLEDISVKKSLNKSGEVELLRTTALPSLQAEGSIHTSE